ncbi:conserved hypothetical protein, unlikely [Trypanosoma brucei gambiense DAL972]|uniref:Uncharacterized protein n=1 Tax=Trypanosoma brucei gambiense (strain MHOM/CI/86/DAL972) TaxID=679716 RepID=C9ZZC9_TRYB9|nr:conserved hypothetical protein, unlikely [Trypanosoma brucei gambiense DAL972]CBH14778.1 conserved hypothetical protein, unlikely [Trypanosoma brucei gambiense DAL972]|eukprot:XP_011777044.1 conserved hypothetical protein, unlikely [Trypanosoma brucei gambiense DAL972]
MLASSLIGKLSAAKNKKTTPIVTWSCVAFCCTSILLFMLPDNVVFSPFVTSFILSFAFLRFFFIHFFLFVVLPLRILKKDKEKKEGENTHCLCGAYYSLSDNSVFCVLRSLSPPLICFSNICLCHRLCYSHTYIYSVAGSAVCSARLEERKHTVRSSSETVSCKCKQ